MFHDHLPEKVGDDLAEPLLNPYVGISQFRFGGLSLNLAQPSLTLSLSAPR